jgi:hypothetical protein
MSKDVTATPASPFVGTSVEQMLALLLAREAKVAAKEAALEKRLEERDELRRRESEKMTESMINTQRDCKHLKGSNTRRRGQQKDPNVYMHTFGDGARMIKCNSCRAKWFPQDNAEFLTRSGSKIPNWTGIGWRQAVEMLEESSNRASSTERFGQAPINPEVSEAAKSLPANVQL